MSSKNAPTDGDDSPRPPRNWSIARRLTVLYALANLCLLVLAAAYLYWSLSKDVGQDDNAFLAHTIQECRRLLREHPTEMPMLAHEIQSEAAASQFIRYYLRLLDHRDQIVLETPGMPKLLTGDSFPTPVEPRYVPPRGTVVKSAQGTAYLMMSARAPLGKGTTELWVIQAALDVSSDQALLSSYRWKLLVMVTLGLLFSCAAGVLVTRSGLRPLTEITQTTEHITATQLHERIRVDGWPVELASLAHSFDRMLNRLEDSFKRLSQFSADLAHELRTPINNLRGEAGVTLSQSRTPEEYRQTLESSLEEYARLGRLIDNLLFLARADAQMTIAREPCDARKAADVVAEFYAPLAAEKCIDLTCEGTATVQAEPILLRQAISNLVANALNYTPPGGRVTVSVEQTKEHGLKLSVLDNGSGIPPEHLPKVCDRFYRGDSSRSQPSNGSGLGLAIVKSIMTLHSGTVEVKSALGEGTTCALVFPGLPGSDRGASACENVSSSSASRKASSRIFLEKTLSMLRIQQLLKRRLTPRETAGITALIVAIACLGYFTYTFASAKILEMKVNAALPRMCAAIREQRQAVIGAIEAYKQHFGFYPPDNIVNAKPLAVDPVKNPLLYEIAGVNFNPTNQTFVLPGFEPAEAKFVKEFFHCAGFTNCATTGREPLHFLSLTNLPVRQLHDDPDVFALAFQDSWVDEPPELTWEFDTSTWRYVSSGPTNNPGKFDLWIELKTRTRSVTVGNWKTVE